MDFLGILGIAAGFALLMLLTYRGWSVYLASFVGAAVVVLCAGLPLAETLTQKYIGGIGSIVTSLLGMFLFSSVMAQLYADSGAAVSLSRAMQRLFLRGPLGPRGRRRMSLLVVIFASALICYGGVNAAVVIITVYPIALSGVLLGGCVTFALSGPGSPQPTNLIPASLLGTSPAAGLVPGLAGMAVEVVVCLLVLDWMIERAVRRGETFEPAAQPDAAASAQVRRPPAALALAPLAVLFLLFNLAGLDILLCTLAGAVCAAVLFYPWLDGYRALRRCINEGLASSLAPVGSIGAVCGFAACVQSVPVFERLVDAIVHWSIDPYLLCMVSVALLCAAAGKPGHGPRGHPPGGGLLRHHAGLPALQRHHPDDRSSLRGADEGRLSGHLRLHHPGHRLCLRDGDGPSVAVPRAGVRPGSSFSALAGLLGRALGVCPPEGPGRRYTIQVRRRSVLLRRCAFFAPFV